jgi:Mn-dependent DtxR family transcriptional regulator
MYIGEREKQVLTYLREYLKQKHYSPSYSEIAKEIGVSKTRVSQILELMVSRGKITFEKNTIRSITIN